MNGRILSIMRKEFIQVKRDPRTLVIIMIVPAMQLLLFGYAVTTNVDHIATVVFDQANDGRSRDLVRAFTNTEYFTVVNHVDSHDEARQAIDRGDARVAFIIPPDFSRNLDSGKVAQLQVMIDGSDPNTASTALFTATGIAQNQAATMVQASLGRSGTGRGMDMPIEIRPNILYNPSMESVNFMIPGLIGLIIQTQAVILTAFAIVREREKGTLEQLIVTPIKSWELMVGKIVPYVIIAFVQVVVAVALGILWFKVPIAGSMTLLMVLSLVFLVGSLGIGLLISTVSQTQNQALQLSMMVMLPSILLSGFVFPREAMPILLYDMGYAVPLTYFLKILRGIALKGIGMEYLWGEVGLLAVFGAVVFTLSAKRFQKKLG
jgi:ABC-2 type transport system permease protein